MSRKQRGFTLIELMVTVAILAILAVVGIPSFLSAIEKNRLKNAVEEVYGLLVEARSEAVVRSRDTLIDVDGGAWCVGYREQNATGTLGNCDCTVTNLADANVCSARTGGTNVLKRVTGADFPGVTISTGSTNTSFDPVRGTAAGRTITLQSGDWEVDVVISSLGRVRTCTPAGEASLGFDAC